MHTKTSRRNLMRTGAAVSVGALSHGAVIAATMPGPRFEGQDKPKICLEANQPGYGPPPANPDQAMAASARRIRQLGVNYVIAGMGPIPWNDTIRP